MGKFFPFSFTELTLLPTEEVAGLDITDSACRLVLLSRKGLAVRASSEALIPAGAIAAGEVKNEARLAETLLVLKKQAGPHFAKHPAAIVSLPAAIFYTHVLDLPEVPEESYEEAARLNALQISPINIDDSYFDWQNLGVDLKTLEREFLIAVALKSKINPYLEALRQAGIEPLAIEPSSLGLVRLLSYFAATAEKNSPHIITHIGKDGLNFVLTKEGKPFFDRYAYWSEISEAKDRAVSRQDFERIVTRETAKLLHFYRTHHKEEVTQAALLSPLLKTELAEALQRAFKLKAVGLRLPSTDHEPLSDLWAGALGAALRGIIPRADDNIVSLMPTGTEATYARLRFHAFASLWTKIGIGTLAGLLMLVAGTTAVLVGLRDNLAETLGEVQRTSSAAEIEALQTRAAEFNALVTAITQAETHVVALSPAMTALAESSEANRARIDRLTFVVSAKEIRLLGFAPNRQAALDFKKALEDTKLFANIELPLGSFSDVSGGVNFAVNLTLR